jgi:hypothetical protein
MIGIVNGERKGIPESSGSFVEGDAVFLQIGSGLVGIPLELHPSSLAGSSRLTGAVKLEPPRQC